MAPASPFLAAASSDLPISLISAKPYAAPVPFRLWPVLRIAAKVPLAHSLLQAA